MKPARYIIESQRREPGRGWVACPEHMAARWVVLCISPKGKPRTISAFPSKLEALAVSDTMNGNLKRRSRERAEAASEPGSRYGPMGLRGKGKVIASGGRDPNRYQRFPS